MKIWCAIAVAVLSACSNPNKSAEKMLEDPQKQEAVFFAILNDEEKLQKFMDRMDDHEQAKEMIKKDTNMMSEMMSDCPMMKGMMQNDSLMMRMMMNCMMEMGKEDTNMCRMMCIMMMDNENMTGMMQDM